MDKYADYLNKLDEIEALKLQEDNLEDIGEEDEAMKCYEKRWELVNELASAIEELSGGRIDATTAKRMVWHKQDQLRELFKAQEQQNRE